MDFTRLRVCTPNVLYSKRERRETVRPQRHRPRVYATLSPPYYIESTGELLRTVTAVAARFASSRICRVQTGRWIRSQGRTREMIRGMRVER
jgi:hypothetical protein